MVDPRALREVETQQLNAARARTRPIGLVQSTEPRPISHAVRELIELGAIDVTRVRLPAIERCKCSHQPGAHVRVDLPTREFGACTTKLCRKTGRCAGYEADPFYGHLPAARGGGTTVVKLRVGDDGKLSRA